MKLDEIDDTEMLYRVVRKSDPDGFIDGEPTAALFMDSGGLSVDRDGGRKETQIVDSFIRRFGGKRDDYENAVKIQAGECRNIGTCLKPAPSRKNQYHAEIHESDSEIEISFLKAIMLANRCSVVS